MVNKQRDGVLLNLEMPESFYVEREPSKICYINGDVRRLSQAFVNNNFEIINRFFLSEQFCANRRTVSQVSRPRKNKRLFDFFDKLSSRRDETEKNENARHVVGNVQKIFSSS